MENYNSNSDSIAMEDYTSDYVYNNVFEEEAKIKKELFKKKMTLISLGTFYVLLLVVSFSLLS